MIASPREASSELGSLGGKEGTIGANLPQARRGVLSLVSPDFEAVRGACRHFGGDAARSRAYLPRMAFLGASENELLFVGFLAALTLIGTYIGDVTEALYLAFRDKP
jgi:hypothetical protein